MLCVLWWFASVRAWGHPFCPLQCAMLLDEDYSSGALIFVWHHTSPTNPAHFAKTSVFVCVCVKLVQGQCENAGRLRWSHYGGLAWIFHPLYFSASLVYGRMELRSRGILLKLQVTPLLISTHTHTHTPCSVPLCQNHGSWSAVPAHAPGTP